MRYGKLSHTAFLVFEIKNDNFQGMKVVVFLVGLVLSNPNSSNIVSKC